MKNPPITILAFIVACVFSTAGAAKETPNVILLLVDDMGYGDIAGKRPEVVERMAAHYEAWWKNVEVELAKRWGD